MGDIKPYNTTFNLEESLKPLWKSTYYTGLAFDWCHRNQNQQGLILKSMRCLIILTSLTLQFYYISISVFQLNIAIQKLDENMSHIVEGMLILWDRFIILYGCFYFQVYRAEIRAFFFDWSHMEEKHNVFKGVDASKMKRTSTIVYTLYYLYGLSFLLYWIYQTAMGMISVTKILIWYPITILTWFLIVLSSFGWIFKRFSLLLCSPFSAPWSISFQQWCTSTQQKS